VDIPFTFFYSVFYLLDIPKSTIIKMTQIQQKLINYLKEYCYSKENAITFRRLALRLDINSRELRRIVADIVINGIAPIGSNSKDGYFYISNEDEYIWARGELFSRIKKLSKRCKGLRISWTIEKEKIEFQQMELIK